MMRRSFISLGLLGAAVFVAVAVMGYHVAAKSELSSHVIAALVACLIVLFVQGWILIYLTGTQRLVARQVGPGALRPRWGLQAMPWGLATLLLVLGSFLLGNATVTLSVPAWTHHAVAYLALIVQLLALWVENRLLATSERHVNELVAAAHVA
jgi:hypothetical protein